MTTRVLLILFGVAGLLSPAGAQSYTPAERQTIARHARQLIAGKYLINMEILTHYEISQPPEALQNHINGLVRDAFLSRTVPVFNEFRNQPTTQTTINEYVKDCRIFSGGKPVVNRLSLDEARYDIQQTKDGQPFINVYVDKQLQGVDKKGKSFQYQNRVEFRVVFVFDKPLNTYRAFKIAGISRADTWPATAFLLTNEPSEPDESAHDLPGVLTTLAKHVAAAFPPNTRQLTLEMFTYNQCGIHTPLSDRIFATLKNCLQKQTQVNILSPAQSTDTTLSLRGYYKQDLNSLQLVAELYNPRLNQVLTTATNSDLPLSWVSQEKLRLEPNQYPQVIARQDTLHQQPTSISPALTVTLRTDRGRRSVEYWEGNSMIVEVNASRPCHLRLVYLQADGSKTLLENDFVVQPGQENRYIRVAPTAEFVCSAPFGTEHLLAYAADEPFCPFPTKPNQTLYLRRDNGDLVLVGSLAAMVKAAQCTSRPATIAEDRLQITTRSLTAGK